MQYSFIHHNKQSVQTKCCQLQDWACILQQQGTVMYRWRFQLCLTKHTDRVCMCLHFTFNLLGSRSLGPKTSRPCQSEESLGSSSYAPTDIQAATDRQPEKLSFFFFWRAPKVPGTHKHTNKSSNLSKTLMQQH